MARNRMTWNKKGSPPPAMPVEQAGYEHPAAQPDPGADDYQTGDTSSWAEDVHPGPYENSAHPAMPDEGPFHPAGKTASELEAYAHRKAAKCIRIAQSLLGPAASVPMIEDQAYNFMHMDDAHLDQTLSRLAGKSGQDEEVEEEVEEEVTSAKEARMERRIRALEAQLHSMSRRAAGPSRRAQMDDMYGQDPDELLLAQMLSEEDEAMGGGDMYGQDEEAMLDDMLLDEMMVEEGMGGDMMMMAAEDDEEASEDKQANALLRQMMAEMRQAAKKGQDDEEESDEEESDEEEEESDEEEEEESDEESEEESDEESEEVEKEASFSQNVLGIELTAGSIDAPDITQNDSVLASLFADDMAKYAAEDDVEAEDEEKEAGKKKAAKGKRAKKAKAPSLDDEIMAAMRPQPKKAAKGATSIGSVKGMSRTAKQEVAELESLWDAPPDVSEFFQSNNF